MNEFTQDELEGIVNAISQKKLTDEELTKVPLRPPGSYGKIAKVAFSPIIGSPQLFKDKRGKGDLDTLKVTLEVIFGKTTLPLKEIENLQEGSLLPLEDLCDDLVEIRINGALIGRGEVIAVDGHFGVRIVSFTKN